MEKLTAIFAASLAAAAFATPVTLAAQPVSGRVDIGAGFAQAAPDSLDTFLGFSQRRGRDANLRLMWQGGTGNWRLDVQTVLSYTGGDTVAYNAALSGMFAPPPPATFFDLSATTATAGSVVSQRIDRLSLGYTGDNFVFRIGRQAVTWGGGTVFRPGDILAPFAPDAVDTAYKPGVDMVYGQYLFANGGDMEAVFVPRRASAGGAFDSTASTYALRTSVLFGDLDGAVLLARDRGDYLLDVALGGPLGDGVWKLDLGQWQLPDGTTPTTFLAGYSNIGSVAGYDIPYFVEYFHNGFGVAPGVALDALPAGLARHLATGQIFNTGRDFLALGGQFSLTPDVSVSTAAIASLNDASALMTLRINWSVTDNVDLGLAATKFAGAAGSEFGGRETAAGSGVYLRPADSLSLRLTGYF